MKSNANMNRSKSLEATLQTSEERFRMVFEDGPLGMTMVDRAGKFIRANSAFCRMLGYTEKEVLQKTFLEITHPDHRQQDDEKVKSLWTGKIPFYKTEKRYLKKNGDVFWGALTVAIIHGVGGKPLYSLAMIEDISERKRSESMLQQLVRDLLFVSHAAMELGDLPREKDLYRLIGEQFEQITPPNTVLAVSEFDEGTGKFRPKCIMGLEKVMEMVRKMLGKNPLEIPGDFGPEARQALLTGKLEKVKTGLGDLAHVLPEAVMQPMAKLLGVSAFYVIGFVKESKVLGGVSIFLRGQSAVANPSVIETVAAQAAMAIARTKAEHALAENEIRYRMVFDHAKDGIALADAETGVLTDCNRAFCEIAGRDKSEIVGHPQSSLHAPQKLSGGRTPSFVEALASSGELIYHDRLVTKTGKEIPVEIRVGHVELNGRHYLLGVFRDITERMRAEEALRKSESQLSNAVKMARLGTWELDVASGIFTFTDSFYAIFHTTAEQMGGYRMSIADYAKRFVYPEDSNQVAEETRKAIETDDPYFSRYVEHRMRYADGGIGHIAVRFFIVKDQSGKTIKTYGVNQDITERKRALEILQESEKKYRMVVENANEGIIVVRDGKLAYANPRTLRILNAKETDLIGLSFLELVHPEDRGFIADRYQQRMRGEAVPDRYEFRVVGLDGKILWVNNAAVLIQWEGKPASLNFLTDITAGKLAEQEKEKLQAQFLQAQKMEAVGRLAGGVAHDFNNLLSAISGYSSLAMAKLNESDPMYRDLTMVSNAAAKAANVVRQLLLFSRKQPIEPVPLNLNSTVKSLAKMLERLIGEDITIEIKAADDLWPIYGDEGSIEQVIMNLAINARDAMPAGGKLCITTENVKIDEAYCRAHSNGRQGDFVRLAITDTGTGMDEKILEHLYEPFFTTKEKGKGTGLGLSVVFGIVQQHKGWVNVESRPGAGTSFTMYFPTSTVHPEQKNGKKVITAEFKGGGERVLLVEDHEEVRFLAQEILSTNGYVVFPVPSAKEALRVFEKENRKFDLVFTDVGLPDQSGVELVDELLKRGAIKVLFSSGYTDEKANRDFIKNKNFRFLQKPYTIPDLLVAVREVLGKKQ